MGFPPLWDGERSYRCSVVHTYPHSVIAYVGKIQWYWVDQMISPAYLKWGRGAYRIKYPIYQISWGKKNAVTSQTQPTKSITVFCPLREIKTKNLFFFFLLLLRQHQRLMEDPRLGVESELQMLVYTTARATPNPSHVCDLHHSSWQHRTLIPLSEARDQTHILMDTMSGS